MSQVSLSLLPSLPSCKQTAKPPFFALTMFTVGHKKKTEDNESVGNTKTARASSILRVMVIGLHF